MAKLLISGIEIKEADLKEDSGLKRVDVGLYIKLESSGDMSKFINKDNKVDMQMLMDFLAQTMPNELTQ